MLSAFIFYISVLCFSVQWLEVLNLISASLTENGLCHSYLRDAKTFQVLRDNQYMYAIPYL